MIQHLFQQGPVIAGILKTAAAAVGSRPTQQPPLPTAAITRTVAPRPRALIDDYLRHIGADPAHYRGVVPAHLWPQWGFPLAAATLTGIPYALTRVLNGGCRLDIHAPLPDDEPLDVRATLEAIDDDGTRALLTQRIVTGTRSAPDAVVATLTAYVPLAKKSGGKEGKEKPTVPEGAREIARHTLGGGAGWTFALLTGDFNPVHWVRPWARAAGFPGTILHGFSTLAHALAALDTARLAGDPTRLTRVDARFVRPLVLPAQIGVYVSGDRLTVGTHPGGPAYMTADVQLREDMDV